MIFLRPWFLLLILLIPVFYYFYKNNHTQNPWKKIINPEFLPFLLVNHHKLSNKKNIFVWLSILWTLLVIALAGPAFEKMPVIADKNPQGTVLIVDLNHLNKTTIPQLKIKLSETVKLLKEERIGLVLYDEKGNTSFACSKSDLHRSCRFIRFQRCGGSYFYFARRKYRAGILA